MSSKWEALPQRRRRRRSANDSTGVSPGGGTPSSNSNTTGESRAETKEEGNTAGKGGDGGGIGINDTPANRGTETSTRNRPEQTDQTTGDMALPESSREGQDEKGSAEGEDGSGGASGGRGASALAAERSSAVARAVEARSTMSRFHGGLEGGAGADGANFEYLDHTADVQLHSWGDTIERAMEGVLAAMFNVITDIGKVDVDPSLTRELEVKGHDAMSLLFAVLDEFLFLFQAEGLAVKKTTVLGVIDRETWTLRARAEGEMFDLSKHPQGTEVKAITYSNMQVNEDSTGHTDIYVIIDI